MHYVVMPQFTYYLNPGLTLEDVAQQVGFSETSTFHRAFKKWTGLHRVYIVNYTAITNFLS